MENMRDILLLLGFVWLVCYLYENWDEFLQIILGNDDDEEE